MAPWCRASSRRWWCGGERRRLGAFGAASFTISAPLPPGPDRRARRNIALANCPAKSDQRAKGALEDFPMSVNSLSNDGGGFGQWQFLRELRASPSGSGQANDAGAL